jgi:hypothetical protein
LSTWPKSSLFMKKNRYFSKGNQNDDIQKFLNNCPIFP